ncbi:MAG: class I SAM-dependent methyltransferase [Acidobacteriota bacterium]
MPFFTAKTAILESVKIETRKFHGTVLDVGCGTMPYRKLIEDVETVNRYLGMDLAFSQLYGDIEPDVKWDGDRIPLSDGEVDCVMATEFLEHHSEPGKILVEIRRVMRDGGRFFATVPFVWNLHEIPSDEYRYTPYSMRRLLEDAGFTSVEIKALGGWNMSLAQMIGLWVTFSKMGRVSRKLLSWALFPVFLILVKTDRKPVEFDGYENSMFTGLSITAVK